MDNNNINKADALSQFDLDAFASDNKAKTQQEALHSTDKPLTPATGGTASEEIYQDVERAVNYLTEHHIDITSPYPEWRDLGFALANGLGESGRELFHRLSQPNPEYDREKCDRKYTNFVKTNDGRIQIGTFFHKVQEAGFDLSENARQRMREAQRQKGRVSATSATPPSANRMENIEKNAILRDFEDDTPVGGVAEVAEKGHFGYTFSDKIKVENLPGFLKIIFQNHPDVVTRDKMLLGVINVNSGLMGGANGTVDAPSGIYGYYAGHRVYAPVYTLTYGSAATRKGDLLFCKLLVRPVRMEMRREYEAAKAKYEEELAAYEAQCRGKNKAECGPAPKEPTYTDPFLSANSSVSAGYRAMEANGGWGIVFETEADTVSNMLASDFGDYSDLWRKTYHHEPVSMSRVSEKLHIDIENPRLSIFITCTPGQLPALFPSFENGLGSRFQFYSLPDDKLEFMDVFAQSDNSLEEAYKQMGEELLPLYHALKGRRGNPVQFVMSKAQQQEFLTTFQKVLVEKFHMLGAGINAFVYRTALTHFRYAMVLTTLRRLSEWNKVDDLFPEDERALVCDDRDFHTAMQIVGCLINHTARVYAVLAKENDNPFANRGLNIKPNELSVYKALPEGEFRTSDFLRVAQEQNIKKRTAERMLGTMCHDYGIIKPADRQGVYWKSSSPKA